MEYMAYTDNMNKITEYLKTGIKEEQTLGLELEHFVYNKEMRLISYEQMSECLCEIAKEAEAGLLEEDGKVMGLVATGYVVTLEPGCQLEVSMEPNADIDVVVHNYNAFRRIADRIFGKGGFFLHEYALFPLIQTGEMQIEEISLLPKYRYDVMDRYFEKTGKYGRYMMRATAATQVSIDFSSEEDAMKKLRVLQKIAPIVALMAENKVPAANQGQWKPYLLRQQIWQSVDPQRCGYLQGSLKSGYSFDKYAEYVYDTAGLLVKADGELKALDGERISAFYENRELEDVPYLLSMYFPVVRLKNYIEYRIADSMDIRKARRYLHFIKTIMYQEPVLDALDDMFADVTDVNELYEAEQALIYNGYEADVYGKPVLELIIEMFRILQKHAKDKMELLQGFFPVQMYQHLYREAVRGREELHAPENTKIKDYLMQSTAKYHNRVVKTLYIPKIFTKKEIEIFSSIVEELYGIFDCVTEHYRADAEYRKLFGFDPKLEELILLPSMYKTNIPMGRMDLFYDENTGNFKFCEFNTDGASAMNEDRELNNAFRLSAAYDVFKKEIGCNTFELFDSWVEEVLNIWEEATGRRERPNVCIVDFLEHATINEFHIFKDAFMRHGCETRICDIRQIKYKDGKCYAEDGMPIDIIYRRAVTSDIMKHYDEVADFLTGVRNQAFYLMGDFRTQIAHNKRLYKVLHMEETFAFLSKEQQFFIRNHIPYTVSLEEAFGNQKLMEDVFANKNNWIIKPEDSYGSKGVHAGIEMTDEAEWKETVCAEKNSQYILQEFCVPYRTENILFDEEGYRWCDTSNLTGMFVYNGKFKGIYSRISYDQMISTQYNEMSSPTIVVKSI